MIPPLEVDSVEPWIYLQINSATYVDDGKLCGVIFILFINWSYVSGAERRKRDKLIQAAESEPLKKLQN